MPKYTATPLGERPTSSAVLMVATLGDRKGNRVLRLGAARLEPCQAYWEWEWVPGNLSGPLLDEMGATADTGLVEALLAWEGEQLPLL